MATGGIVAHCKAGNALTPLCGADAAYFDVGSGLDDAQGDCAWFWSGDLCHMTGIAASARFRAEFRDGWNSRAFCNAGPIAIHRGVVDFQGNLDFWGGEDSIDVATSWKDDANLIGSFMGFNIMDPWIKASDTLQFSAPAGRQSDITPSVLDGKFVELDCTPQVNWILQHTKEAGETALSGQYAIVFLVTPGQGSIGKVSTYTAEEGAIPAIGSDTPWTRDGNTGHLVVEGNITSKENPALRDGSRSIALSQNTPNPFSARTSIAYNAGSRSGVLRIFDAGGRMVLGRPVTGRGSVEWNASQMVSGIYLCRLAVGSSAVTKRMALFK
jgi:hypothetical protein